VCGDHDDLEEFFPSSSSMMPSLEIDPSSELILERYARERVALNQTGFFLGRARLAVCTRRHRERGPHEYLDMDYWADLDRSVYRPQWTLEELQRAPNFTYLDRRFVLAFREDPGGVQVRTTHADTGAEETNTGTALVLAGGTLGTARIVLASLGLYDRPIPLLCNPYAYVPTLNLAMLRRGARERRYSLAQLTAILCVNGKNRIVQAQVFSYRSLLTFKLMKETPLAYREALRILRVLIPKFAILGIHHEDRPGAGQALRPPPRGARPAGRHVSPDGRGGARARGRPTRPPRLLPPPGARPAPDDAPRPRREPALRRYLPDPSRRRRAHVPARRPAPRDARRLPGRRLDLPVDPAEGAHLQPDGERRPRRHAAREAPRVKAVVVTGATGSLGRPLCARLARGGWEVRALVRDPARVPGMRAGRCDLPDAIDESLLPGAFALVHCAYATRETDQERARRVNEDGMRRLLEASRRAGIPRFVFISSVVAHPDAPNYYGAARRRWSACSTPSATSSSARGRSSRARDRASSCRCATRPSGTHVLPVFGGGKQPLQTVHIDDVCEAITRALDRDVTGELNVAEPEPVPFGTFLRMMTERLGIKCRFVPLPFGAVLAVRGDEAIGVPLPLRTESLLGVKALGAWTSRSISAGSISACAPRQRAWRTWRSFSDRPDPVALAVPDVQAVAPADGAPARDRQAGQRAEQLATGVRPQHFAPT
jgi:nucleoside-diphosphate-sugar epimerase